MVIRMPDRLTSPRVTDLDEFAGVRCPPGVVGKIRRTEDGRRPERTISPGLNRIREEIFR